MYSDEIWPQHARQNNNVIWQVILIDFGFLTLENEKKNQHYHYVKVFKTLISLYHSLWLIKVLWNYRK
jgi:hypothetical protein